jgi:hypothetical protein
VTIDPSVWPSCTWEDGCDVRCDIWNIPGDSSGGSCGESILVGGSDPTSSVMYGVLRFHVDALPPGAIVESVLVEPNAEGSPTMDEFEFFELTTPWDTNVTWTTSDGSTPWPQGPNGEPGAGALYAHGPALDRAGLSDTVQRWALGVSPNYGVLMRKPSGCCVYALPTLSFQWAPTDDPDGLQGVAAEWYSGYLGVSLEEAMRRLRIQDRVSNIEDDLEDAIAPGDFGGVWFDEADAGRGKIGIETNLATPPSSKTQDAEEVLENHNLEGEVDFVAVAHSLDELEDAGDDLTAALSSLLAAGKVRTSIRPQTNAIVLYKANSLTPAEESAVATAVAGAGVTVNVEAVPSPDLGGREDVLECKEPGNRDDLELASDWDKLGCDSSPRAGQLIRSGTNCSAGLMAEGLSGYGTAGKRFIITAGHCVMNQLGQTWRAMKTDGSFSDIGPSVASYGGVPAYQAGPRDYGLVEILAGSAWYSGAQWGYIYRDKSNANGEPTERTAFLRVTTVTRSPRRGRRVVCQSSAYRLPNTGGRHTQCGHVDGFDGNYSDNGRSYDKLAETEFCGIEGASGGPVYKNGIVYGIWSGSETWGAGGCQHGFYQGIREAEDRLHVRVIRDEG